MSSASIRKKSLQAQFLLGQHSSDKPASRIFEPNDAHSVSTATFSFLFVLDVCMHLQSFNTLLSSLSDSPALTHWDPDQRRCWGSLWRFISFSLLLICHTEKPEPCSEWSFHRKYINEGLWRPLLVRRWQHLQTVSLRNDFTLYVLSNSLNSVYSKQRAVMCRCLVWSC